jgi:hypothetical protein
MQAKIFSHSHRCSLLSLWLMLLFFIFFLYRKFWIVQVYWTHVKCFSKWWYLNLMLLNCAKPMHFLVHSVLLYSYSSLSSFVWICSFRLSATVFVLFEKILHRLLMKIMTYLRLYFINSNAGQVFKRNSRFSFIWICL